MSAIFNLCQGHVVQESNRAGVALAQGWRQKFSDEGADSTG